MLQYKAKANWEMTHRRPKDNFTSLLLAAAEGNVDAVKILMAAGADIFAQVIRFSNF